jgi:fructan beta-fructosidase
MTIPRELLLQKVDGELVVASVPVKELEKIRNKKVEISSQVISGKVQLELNSINPMRSEMVFNFQLKNGSQFGLADEFGIRLNNEKGEEFRIAYSHSKNEFITDRSEGGISSFSNNFAGIHTAPYQASNEVEIRVFVDEASIEVFVDGGKLVFTDIVFPSQPYNMVDIFSTNGSIKLHKAQVWSLSSVW